ncbi:hypothetical protein [Alteromonas stellipolaris]|uniref:Fibronectin type-III domain-containing protein n=1 Tax=Alteromonas stellipolaris TaxID=233316 RepID=A0ABM5YQ61_9ALTE|nr:hypothetical protein AVL57_01000 [Alteromonas stellipolaris]
MRKCFYAALFLPLYLHAATERQVVFVHSDILGSPVTETTPGSGSTPARPSNATIRAIFTGVVRVSWSSVTDATYYKIELIKGKNCGQIIYTNTTSKLVADFIPQSTGDYAARVSACSGSCSSAETTSWVSVKAGSSSADVSCTF